MKKRLITSLGIIGLGGTIYLSFVNWHAAVIVLLFLIVANTAK